MNKIFQINGRKIGDGQPCFVIAEAGVNHNGRMDMARKLVTAAAGAGADAVKFQTFRAEEIATAAAPFAPYQKARVKKEDSQFAMLRKLELSREDFKELSRQCDEQGIVFLSTPFDPRSADLLNDIGVGAFKISSGDMNNHPLLEHIAAFGKPMILSTGMATMEEVRDSVDCVSKAGLRDLALLQCVSCYPAQPAQVNLRAMDRLREAFNIPVGYSDHTLGDFIPLAAVARGACIVEKHLTLRRSLPGPDHLASMIPSALAAMMVKIRSVEAALGSGEKSPDDAESKVAAVARKSIHLSRDIAEGEILSRDMLCYLRPAGGLPPDAWRSLVGRRVIRSLARGERLSLDVLAK